MRGSGSRPRRTGGWPTCSSTTTGRPVRRPTRTATRSRASRRRTSRSSSTRELWFVVVANPDGYDFTFTPGNRLWRKNLRDNDGNGNIDVNDGVDPNRNFPTAWKYDDEGSSGDPTSETYRGTGPASEPETRALDGLMRSVRFKMQINYHTAAELLLYPYGFQVETYTEDDPIYRALSGTGRDSRCEGHRGGRARRLRPGRGRGALHHERRDHGPRAPHVRDARLDA
jgi:hypothetical protein